MMRMKRREFLVRTGAAGATVLLGSSFAGCISEPAPTGAIQIGTIISLTGDLGSYGVPIQNGAILAAKHVNEKGGVMGRQLTLIHEDDRTTPQGAVEAMQKLVNVNKVPAVVGALGSSNTLAIMPIGRNNKVVMISPSSTSPAITTADDGDYLFRTAASDAFQGKVLVKVARDMGYTKIAHLYINNDYGVAMNDVVKGTAPADGGNLVAEVPYNPGATSYRSELTALTQSNPEALIFTGYPEYGTVILRQAKELGIKSQWILSEGLKDPLLIDQLGGELLEGMVGTAPKPASGPQYNAFLDAYKKEFNADPGVYSDTCYDATTLIALAIEEAGKVEGTAIREVLRSVSKDYNGVSGPVDFDANGDVTADFEEWAFSGGGIVSKRVVSL